MADSKQTHDISLPKSSDKSSLESRASMGTLDVDVGGPKHSYWQSFMPQKKNFVKKKLNVLYSQKNK
tara:strand:+ start:143 stop:343 length:201 start_codon:yes stop_codon:yes gene_type:complete